MFQEGQFPVYRGRPYGLIASGEKGLSGQLIRPESLSDSFFSLPGVVYIPEFLFYSILVPFFIGPHHGPGPLDFILPLGLVFFNLPSGYFLDALALKFGVQLPHQGKVPNVR